MPDIMPSLISRYELPQWIPQLDSLRGLAILSVLMMHISIALPGALAGFTSQGWLGVDLFFVLSGFLITGILWDTRGRERYFGRFYGRRALRIWPAYLVILFIAFIVLPLLRQMVGGMFLVVPREPLGPWQYLLMIQNLFPKRLNGSPVLPMTWSLAIEEQFYLVWPVVIRYAPRRVVLPSLIAVFLSLPLFRIWAISCGVLEGTLYANSLTHCDGLLCGAAVAIWLRSARPRRRTLLQIGIALLLIGFLMFLPIRPTQWSRPWSPLVFTSAALLFTGLLLVALVSENCGYLVHRFFFMNRALAFFGFISYSLYLYHFLIVRIATSPKLTMELDRWRHPHLTSFVMVTCGVGICTLLAWISRVTLERAALARKGIFG